MTTKHCILYGMEVVSDLALPEGLPSTGWQQGSVALRAAARDDHPTMTFSQSLPDTHGRSLTLSTDRRHDRPKSGQRWCVRLDDVGLFQWTSGSKRVEYQSAPGGLDGPLAFWFVHILLPLYMALEEQCDFIHGSAVELDDRAVYLVAPSRFGKSTLAAHCVGRGNALIADDKIATLPLETGFLAVPSHPYHRVYRREEDLGCLAGGYAAGPKRLSALFLLEKAAPDDPVRVTEIEGYRKFRDLFSHYLFRFTFLQQERMAFLAALANAVPFYSLALPWDPARLDEVLEAISVAGRRAGRV